MNRTNDTVIIAHDYICPWCWIGLFQAQRLAAEFPSIAQDWRGYELLPESLGPFPDYTPKPPDPDAPPSRLQLLSALDGIPIPPRTTRIASSHNALEGCEYVKEFAPEQFDAYNEGVYRAYWERSADISNHDVLAEIAENAGVAPGGLIDAIAHNSYFNKIIAFDDDAYRDDIAHVPTFVFRGERCAEAPYSTIRNLAQRYIAWYQPQRPAV